MKTPDVFDMGVWKNYIVSAFQRETGKRPNAFLNRFFHMKIITLVETDSFDPYMLAIGIDLLALSGSLAEEVIYEGLTGAALIRPFFARPRSRYFWRSVWFSRFAETEKEVKFFRYWLRQYEYAFESDQHGEDNNKLIAKCKAALDKAEKKIREEKPEPSFTMDWLRDNMGEK